MMIQRWQSLFLLLAAIMMCILNFTPWATIAETQTTVNPVDIPVFFIINMLIALILLLSIFMYKNIQRQKTMTLLSMLLIVVSGVTGLFMTYNTTDGSAAIEWIGGIILLIMALILTVISYRRISADDRLLKSVDRIR